MSSKLLLLFVLFTGFCKAQTQVNAYQNNLSKRITFDVKKQKVSAVLQQMSTAGNFYFAYNGALFKQDSLVTLNAKALPVRDVLDQIFDGKVDYKENDNYVILRYAVNHFTIEADNITTAENLYIISGHVIDTETGKKVKQASVYEKKLLQSTLTDDEGYFTLKFKGEHKAITLTASKETYRDTALVFLSSIDIKPQSYNDPDKEKGTFFSNTIEDLGISRFLLSAKQRMQNINIPNFLANTPFQASLTPGLSSHGMMSAKVVNKVSLNVLGGYTAGVNGVEVAGLFNLSKGDVNKLQIGGLFNVVGGNVTGVQIAGLANNVRGSTKGIQIAGSNFVKSQAEGAEISGIANVATKNMNGFQLTGLANVTGQNMNGFQLTGLVNFTGKDMQGMQLAGIGNITSNTLKGMQLAGIFNYAKNNKGFQLGLVNISDTSSGVSLGLFNYVKNGYHKISLTTNELINANIALKTGNASLYSILFGGVNFSDTAKIETFGVGFGHDFIFSKRFSVSTELTAQQLHLGNWDYANILTKFQTNLQIQLFKGFTVFGGPSYNYYISNAPLGSSAKNYRQKIAPNKHQIINGHKGWLGYAVGITIM